MLMLEKDTKLSDKIDLDQIELDMKNINLY
jgi:hypothetical protein